MIKPLNVLFSYVEKKAGSATVRCKPWKISLEVALSCNLRCITCRHGLEQFGGIMTQETFERVKPILAWARVVNEVGYGEPLLDPHFLDKLRYAKRLRAAVFAYSNGMLLTPERCEQLVALGLDQLTFSVDGGTPQTLQSIRVGADYRRILDNIRLLHQAKLRRRSKKPYLRANFVGMRRNIEELPRAVQTLAEAGIQEVILSDMMPLSAELAREHLSLFPQVARAAVAEARNVARRYRIGFSAPRDFPSAAAPLFPDEPAEHNRRIDSAHRPAPADSYRRCPCYEPWQTICVTHDGHVQPCCAIARSFGNLFEQDIETIWNGPLYRALRQSVNGPEPAFPECRQCLLRQRVRLPLRTLLAMGAHSLLHGGVARTARAAMRYVTEYA